MPVRALFTATILLSAFLLLLIQPILSKIILPKLGGSPAVWQTSMMFYQALLLGGYVYAHAASRWLGSRRHALLHSGLLLLSTLTLPITLHVTSLYEPTAEPVLFLLVSLLVTISLPFFVLAANAPLIQHWHACHTRTCDKDPYMLYSASNLGSFAALLSYPFLIEPYLTLSRQTDTWSMLYALFGLLLLLCIIQLHRHFNTEAPLEGETQEQLEAARTPSAREKATWTALAFIPSSLMLGVTTHVSSDIAAVPLLWIVPLALYLLSFVLTFHSRMPGHGFFLKEQVMIIAMLLMAMITGLDTQTPFVFIHYLGFFAVAMVCHGQLSLSRPSSRHLTGFYVWISVGGALGGVFNALIAPQFFTTAHEYVIMLVLACFLRPQTLEFSHERLQRVLDALIPVVVVGMLAALSYLTEIATAFFPETTHHLFDSFSQILNKATGEHTLILLALLSLCLALPWICQHRPIRFGLMVGLMFLAMPYAKHYATTEVLHRERNFFGISKVLMQKNPPLHVFMHGTTLHGMQALEKENRLKLTSYYAQVQSLFNSLPDEIRLRPVAVAGLGAGTLACLGKEQQVFDFFEIDSAVKRIAENPAFFTYLRDCPTQSTVTIQDARLGIEAAKDGRYGVILMDAYSSDSLPMHLITREALSSYLKKLAPGGVIGFHISNRYLKLETILSNLAADAGLVAIHRISRPSAINVVSSHWVFMARNHEDLASTNYKANDWNELTPNGNAPWTDNYSNILEALR